IGGPAADDVYLAGGGLGFDGRGALLLHYDGASFREIDTGVAETLWWVSAPPVCPPDVWAVGEGGRVIRYDGAAVTTVPTSSVVAQATLFGVLRLDDGTAWIVGGVPNGARHPANDLILRWDGHALVRDATVPRAGVALYKMWGASSDDLWVVGE